MPSPPELPAIKGSVERLLWTGGAVCNQLVWGMQPVLTRWLQGFGHVDAMSLVFMALMTSFGCNVLASALQSQSEPTTAKVPSPTASEGESAGGMGRRNFGMMVAGVYACRSSTNFLSAALTQAYTVAMIQMLGVFVMAGGSWLVLHEEVPPAMWLALIVSLGGTIMVFFGRSGGQDPTPDTDADAGLDHWDGIGIAVQAASLLFSTGARLQMRTSEGIFTPMEFMRCQYLGGAVISLLWITSVTGFGVAMEPWLQLSSTDWAIFFALSILIHFVAATSQVHFNRKLGVATYACFQPMRLVGSVIGSATLLGEPVTGWLTWVGLVTVGATVSVYAVHKQRVKSSAQPRSPASNRTVFK